MIFGEREIAKAKFYAASKLKKVWDVNVDNIVISILVKTKTNSSYCIGYFDKTIRPLILIMPKMSRYVKSFKVKEVDKGKNNKLVSFSIDDEKLFTNLWWQIYKIQNTNIRWWNLY